MTSGEPRPSSAALRVLRRALALIAALFVVYAIRDLARDWDAALLDLEWGYAALALVPAVLAAFIAGRAWIALIEHMAGRRVPRGFALRLYFESQLARYTPGKVGLPLVRMAGAPRLGLPARAVGTSVLVEVMSWLAVGAAVGFALLALFGRHVGGVLAIMGAWAPFAVAAIALGTIVLCAVPQQRLPRFVRRWLGLDGEAPLLPARLLGYHVAFWAVWGLHGYLVGRAVGAAHEPALGSAGLFVLAPIAGFLALVAPAGLGVREAVLSVGLAPAVGAAPALSAALISRAASLISDVGTWVWARAWFARTDPGAQLGGPGAGT